MDKPDSDELDEATLQALEAEAKVPRTYEEWLEHQAEMMGRLAKDEALRRHFAKRLS